jgi:DeoR family fructose operon transcriptional repressor
MFSIGRKAEIISLLEQVGEVDVSSLSERFAISKETVRRDLRELEREGMLVRTHGGGVYNRDRQSKQAEYPVTIRGMQRFHEKNAICRGSASLIEDGDTIFIDNSSTTMYLAQYIPKQLNVTILTNSLKVLLEAVRTPNPNIQYFCFGGIFKEYNLSFFGNTTLKNAEAYYPNRSFLGCAGIRENGETSDSSMQEVDTKQLMIHNSKETTYLVDHTKFSTFGQVHLSKLKPGDTIITDNKTPQENIDLLRTLGLTVLITRSIER